MTKKLSIIGVIVLGLIGIAFAQFAVSPQGDITAHSINLIPPCTGYLYNNAGTLTCQPGTGGGATLGPSVSATDETSYTIGSGVQYLSFSDNVWDTGNLHPLSGDLTKFTAPSAGYYLAFSSLFCNANNASYQLFFRVNGLDVQGAGGSQTTSSGNMNSIGSYSSLLYLNAGDVVQAATYMVTSCTTVPYYSTMQLTKLASIF